MIKYNLLLVLSLCALSVYPASSINRWFSATFEDMRYSLHRYGRCYGDLPAISSHGMDESEYFVQQMKSFLDAANYDNEQLANVSSLMDKICLPSVNSPNASASEYTISLAIDVNKYSSKSTRCRAIDEALDALYPVFKRPAWNRSESLDFSTIQFYPDASNRTRTYNISDLINTVWIKSETMLDVVCTMTDSMKEYVRLKSSNSTAQDRSQQSSQTGGFGIINMFDQLLERLFGFQRRLYWESSNRIELLQTRVSSGIGSLRNGIGSGLKNVRSRLTGLISSPAKESNSTTALSANMTTTTALPKSTKLPATSTTPSKVLATSTTTMAPISL